MKAKITAIVFVFVFVCVCAVCLSLPVCAASADGLQSEAIPIVAREYALLKTPFVRLLLLLLAGGAFCLALWFYISQRTKKLIRQRQQYKETAGQIMSVAAAMADAKEYAEGHSVRVASYAKMVGVRLGMDEDELETLYYAALLHDIGKVTIPDAISGKKGPLTNEEYEMVKKHVVISGDWLSGITVMGDIAAGARYHHERIDGKGYAEGLGGDAIPLMAKIIGACGALDSMLSEQPYRKALPVDKAVSEFISNAGTQFDERVTSILISLVHEGGIPCK